VSRAAAAVAVAVFAAGTVVAPAARADEPTPTTPPTPAPEATAPERGDDAVESPPPSWRALVLRLGAVGAYRGLYDLNVLGGGVALSIGGESQTVGGHGNLRVIDGRTPAGLHVFEWALTGTVEWRVDNVRLGFGGGWTYFGVQRATDGSWVQSLGPVALLRGGYDFGERSGAFLLADCQIQLQAGGAYVWGPTLELGYRF
jgi:hypothetical protein